MDVQPILVIKLDVRKIKIRKLEVQRIVKRQLQVKLLFPIDLKTGRETNKNKPLRRRLAMLAENPQCHYCHCELNKKNSSLDHKLARSKGGPNTMANLVLACLTCNTKKGNGPYKKFYESMKSAREKRDKRRRKRIAAGSVLVSEA